METISCHRCHGATRQTNIAIAEGSSDPLRIRLRNLPLLTCEREHRQFVRPGFAAELLEHLTREDEPSLPAGEEKGLFMKHYYCESCGAELEAKVDHRHTFGFTIKLKDLDEFGVDLSMPVYRCSSCATEQLHSLKETRKLTPQALADAFLKANIPPPPV